MLGPMRARSQSGAVMTYLFAGMLGVPGVLIDYGLVYLQGFLNPSRWRADRKAPRNLEPSIPLEGECVEWWPDYKSFRN